MDRIDDTLSTLHIRFLLVLSQSCGSGSRQSFFHEEKCETRNDLRSDQRLADETWRKLAGDPEVAKESSRDQRKNREALESPRPEWNSISWNSRK
jgi:hypothetical protein